MALLKKKKPNWLPVLYSCPLCNGDILEEIKMVKEVLSCGGTWDGGPMPTGPILGSVPVDTGHFRCSCCGKEYSNKNELNGKPSPEFVPLIK